MLALSWQTYYIGEIFRPDTQLLDASLIPNWYPYIRDEFDNSFKDQVKRILDLRFTWPRRSSGFRQYFPSSLVVLKHLRRWFGLPRPIIKDPFAAMLSEWLTTSFEMDIVCIIRHPASVVASLKRANWRFDFTNFLHQPELVQDWLIPFLPFFEKPPKSLVEEGALLWACVYFVLTSQAERHPSWMLHRLEDISNSPLTHFGSVYEHLGLPYTGRIRRSIWQYCNPSNPAEVSDADLHTIKRNSSRIPHLWRNQLEPSEVKRIRNIVEPVSNRYYSDLDWIQ